MKVLQMRLRSRMTQEELARLCETTQQQIAKIERGVVDSKLSTLRRIAEALDCELIDLFLTKKEFLSLANGVIKVHKINLKKAGLMVLNDLCSEEKKIFPLHPFWEQVVIQDNRIQFRQKEKEKNDEKNRVAIH